MKKRGRRTITEQSYAAARLLDALGREGCPVCHDIARSDRHYFFWFFVESYFSSYTLDQLSASLGFCPAHGARLARSSGDSHQLTYVHEDMARRIIRALGALSRGGAAGRKRKAGLLRPGPCPPCREREQGAASAAFWLAAILEEPSHAGKYGDPGLLCFPHLRLLCPRVGGKTLEGLLALHRERMSTEADSLSARNLCRISPGDKEGLLETLLPALRLAVGHDRGLRTLPEPGEAAEAPRLRDPAGDFLERLRWSDACPVCLEVSRAWGDWLRWLDEAAQRGVEIRDLLPGCPDHVWDTIHMGGKALAVAVAQKALGDTLGQLAQSMNTLAPAEKKKETKWPLVGRLREFLPEPPPPYAAARRVLTRPPWCPVCNHLNEVRDRSLHLLFALLRGRPGRTAMENGYGLCLKHFSRALALRPEEGVGRFLAEVESARLSLLLWELEEARRKAAWSVRPEPRGTESWAWKRGVWRFSGRLGNGSDAQPEKPSISPVAETAKG
ncbi:MAG: hypothetical protein HYY53_01965 [candidate division NC10 bacterium]|uniref:Uncharacterized protein n=1 Tax=Tectimicrobiota bacterium TaxID=2528274 RepID=A0A932I246_UNCTE|nr:hypothetical protein [candidate division NC10 bacterium]MBI3128372.1 hypothetical protein [Candidatus Tectomicrobia bacterium]